VFAGQLQGPVVDDGEGLAAAPEVDGQVRGQDRVLQDRDHPLEFILKQGPMLCFSKYFDEIFGENIGFFAQTTTSFCKNVIITMTFDKKAIFFAENWQKSQKIANICNIVPRVPPGHGCQIFLATTYQNGKYLNKQQIYQMAIKYILQKR
jgi:hypothetical protein